MAANEQLLAAENTYNLELERSKVLINSTGDEVGNLDRFRTTEENGDVAFDSSLFASNANKQAVEELNNIWKEAGMSIQTYKNHISMVLDSSTDLESVNKGVKGSYAEIYKANLQIAEIQKTMKPEDQRPAIEKVIAALKQQDAAAGKIVDKYVDMTKPVEEIVQGMKTAESNTRRFAVATGSSEKHISQMEDGIVRTNAALQQSQSAAENFRNKMEQAMNSLSQGLAGAMSIGNVAASMASGFSTIAMGITSITNAIDTLNDDDASFTTKLSAGAMAATMGIRALTTTLGGLNTVVNSVRTATAMKEAVDMASAVATGKQTQAELENLLVTKLGVAEDKKAAAAEAIVTAAKKSGSAATVKDTIANWANVASQAAKFWYISLIIIAITALIGLIYAIVTAEDAETKALKVANEQLENSKNAYDRARDAAANFKEEVADYQDALNGLKEMEAGSEELANAVEEVNKKARALIETYGLFSKGDWSYGANGEIIISEQALKDAQEDYNNRAKRAEIEYYSAQANQVRASTNAKAKDYTSKMGTYTTAREYVNKTEHGYTSKAYVGDYLDPTGVTSRNYVAKSSSPRSAAAVNGQTGIEVKENKITTAQMRELGRVVGEVEEELGHVPATAQELIEAIKASDTQYGLSKEIVMDLDGILEGDAYTALLDFCEGIGDAAEASRHYAEQILGLMTDDDYAEAIKNASGGDEGLSNVMYAAKNTLLANSDKDLVGMQEEKQKQLYDDVINPYYNWDDAYNTEYAMETFVNGLMEGVEGFNYDEWLKTNYGEIFKGTSQTYDGDLSTEDMGRALLESQGYEITNVDNKNGKIIYSVMGENGAEEVEYGNDEIMNAWSRKVGNAAIDQYISDEAMGVLNPETFEDTMTQIVQHGEQFGANFSNAIIAGIANNGTFDFSSIFGEISQSEFNEINGMSGQQLAEKFLGITDEEQLKELGLGTFEEFATGFKQGMDEWDPSVYRDSMNKKYEQIAEDNDIDVGQFKAYRKSTEAREGFEDDSGSQSADKWLDELESTNIEEYTEALNELAIMQTRLSRGYDTLASNWEDWNGVMTDTEASIDEINEIMPDLNDALADILNWDVADVELLPHDFAQKHWDVIQDVYNGVDGAQERLAGLAANEYVVSLDVDTEGFSTDVGNAYTTVTGWLQNMPDLEVGMTLDDTGMTTAFNALLESGAVTVEQMNNILSKIGFTPEIAYKDVEITGDHKQQIVSAGGFTKVNADGSTTWVPINNETEVDSYVGSTMQVPYIKGEKTPYTGGGGVSPKPPKDRNPGGGGGGGSKPKKTSDSRKDKNEIVDRYKEIND